jgi:hypothetical protein
LFQGCVQGKINDVIAAKLFSLQGPEFQALKIPEKGRICLQAVDKLVDDGCFFFL